ncbi:hypothetical protein [Streptomyces sp. NRRL F-5123]|uniref:hypothetical protein n=1 Tax=Streptomyces sp. NRRL F-5123 TaxID=1463856 RepID=UPI0006941220|nr:hypothetical protein [Streptomyces sp. NRRL F-5123]
MAVTVAVVVGGLPARADPVPSPGPTTTTTAPAPTTTTAPLTAAPTPAPSSCAPQDCIPQPGSSAPTDTPAPGATSPPPDAGGGPGGITGWITKGINAAIGAFFKTIITAALNPLLKLLGDTLLATPSLSSLPRVGELWQNSWEIVLAVYAILIALAGIVLMSYESLQSRYSVKEIAPRIPVGLLAAGLSLFLAGKAVDLANALSHAVMGAGADGEGAGNTLATFVLSSFVPGADLFTDIMWVVVIGVLVALLITYVVRVALTVILVAGAPLALMCHALPQTDGIARWWWRTFGGVLAIQVAQSLTLITGIRVFLNPGGLAGKGLFGGVSSGLVNLLVTLALTYILFKIPFWILGSVRVGQGRSFAGRAARAYLMYQTLGMLRGAGNARAAVPSGPNGVGTPRRPGGAPAPVAPRRAVNPAAAAPVARRRPPGQPVFRAPGQSPQAAASPRRAAGPPPMPTFQAPGAPGTPAPVPRPAQPPGTPTFRAPGAPARVRATARPTGPPPRQPLFRQPVPANPVQPRRVTAPPPPATFREPRPRAGAAQVPPPPRRTPPGGDRR